MRMSLANHPLNSDDTKPTKIGNLLYRIVNRIRSSLDLQDILNAAAREARTFLSIDRVKIYRFDEDGSGEVVAESIQNNRLPSLLGLHFPAEDIPTEARRRLAQDRCRAIANVESNLRTLSALHVSNSGVLEREETHQMELDPCHAEYLTNMGVCSSLVLPIFQESLLWGLLSCHHSEPRHFTRQEMNMMQLVVNQLAIALAQAQLLQRTQQQVDREASINLISALLHTSGKTGERYQVVLEKIIEILGGDSGRLYIAADPTGKPAELYAIGPQPSLPCLEETDFWREVTHDCTVASPPWESVLANPDHASPLQALQSCQHGLSVRVYNLEDLHTNVSFQPYLWAFGSTRIRSLALAPLHYQQQCVGCLTIFRNEIQTEILWAGRQDGDWRNDRPRQSFDTWREVKKGQALPWTIEDLEMARAIAFHIYLIAAQKRVETLISHQAYHDSLTGLANRLLFHQWLSIALASRQQQGSPIALVFLDLDGFKHVNDTLGHDTGDRVLQSVAARLSTFQTTHCRLARWGGDEFAFLVSQILDRQEAEELAREILAAFSKPICTDRREFYIKASLGVAIAPQDGEDADTLLKNADAAMYRAKQTGRNNYQVYAPSISTQSRHRLTLETNLNRALQRGELQVHYQPQLDLDTQAIVGAEALLRWHHPKLGWISPGEFIPIAEETGSIATIGEWVLREACRQTYQWQQSGLPDFRIAVNLSGLQLHHGLLATATRICRDTMLDPQYLEVEIVESVAIQDMDRAISVLQELQEAGVRIALDDFGTGYSSLWWLHRLPIDKLKVDRSFISPIPEDASNAAIVRAIVAMGQELQLCVLAEGVETEEQLNFLKEIGCNAIQGYKIARPLPADRVEAFCKSFAKQTEHQTA